MWMQMCVCASDKFKEIHGYNLSTGVCKLGLSKYKGGGQVVTIRDVKSLKKEPKSCQN